MIYLYLFGTCFHFIYVFMIIGNTFITDFKQLLISHPSVKTRLLGFPRNWEQEPLWR